MKNYILREALASDIPYLYSAWLNSYKYDSYLGIATTNTTFFENYRLIIDDILSRKSSEVLLACVMGDESVILGFVVTEGDNVVHYLYVKEPFRLLGIATDLVLQAIGVGGGGDETVYYTHKTYSSEKYLKNRPSMIYDPFILFMKGEE